MRATEFLLNELFDRPNKAKIDKYDRDAEAYTARFKTSAGLQYEINIGQLFAIEDDAADEVLSVIPLSLVDDMSDNGCFIMFHQDGNADITGSGNSVEVMSTVLNVILAYIKKFKPSFISYHAREPSRQKLYSSIARKLNATPVGNNGQYFVWKI